VIWLSLIRSRMRSLILQSKLIGPPWAKVSISQRQYV